MHILKIKIGKGREYKKGAGDYRRIENLFLQPSSGGIGAAFLAESRSQGGSSLLEENQRNKGNSYCNLENR